MRRKKVADALYWLTGVNERGEPNNFLYQNVKIDSHSLQTLPENGMLTGVNTFECIDDDASDEPGIDTGPDNSESHEKVYNDESEMSSFLPTNLHKKKEKDIINDEFTTDVFFLRQNPSEANLTLDDFKQMLQSNTHDSFMNLCIMLRW